MRSNENCKLHYLEAQKSDINRQISETQEISAASKLVYVYDMRVSKHMKPRYGIRDTTFLKPRGYIRDKVRMKPLKYFTNRLQSETLINNVSSA